MKCYITKPNNNKRILGLTGLNHDATAALNKSPSFSY